MVRVTLIPEEWEPVTADEEVVKMFGIFESYIDGSGNYSDQPIPIVKKSNSGESYQILRTSSGWTLRR